MTTHSIRSKFQIIASTALAALLGIAAWTTPSGADNSNTANPTFLPHVHLIATNVITGTFRSTLNVTLHSINSSYKPTGTVEVTHIGQVLCSAKVLSSMIAKCAYNPAILPLGTNTLSVGYSGNAHLESALILKNVKVSTTIFSSTCSYSGTTVATLIGGNCEVAGTTNGTDNKLQAFVAAEVNGVWGSPQEVASNLNEGNAKAGVVVCPTTVNCIIGGSYTDANSVTQAFTSDRSGQLSRES